ncbi:hypothetical protein THOM_2431 [Trachipleistophora hominis]|uniref:Uncharacterized protein n=1 Tax=Trachipleistophora hominis TaxID=72359 RepID=L7JV74_TRAHO|nr:hypothetical protein THOM_2431 [Trachipleistophora hominis]
MSNRIQNRTLTRRNAKKLNENTTKKKRKIPSTTAKNRVSRLNNINYYEITSEGMSKSKESDYVKRLESPENSFRVKISDSFNWSEYDRYLREEIEQETYENECLITHAELFIDCMKKMEREFE